MENVNVNTIKAIRFHTDHKLIYLDSILYYDLFLGEKMSKPQNPNTIIVKNDFYPQGLTEKSVWNYYQKYKGPLLKEVMKRYVVIFVMIDINKPIVKRKGMHGMYISLTNTNYDHVVTGRTISFHSVMKTHEDIAIIDIDCDKWDIAKQATIDVYNVVNNYNFVQSSQIKYTGKSSFHVVCNLNRKLKINQIRNLFLANLKQEKKLNNYTIEYRRLPGIPNIDLSSNKYNGAFITHNSLSILGLRCMNLNYRDISSFQKNRSKIM